MLVRLNCVNVPMRLFAWEPTEGGRLVKAAFVSDSAWHQFYNQGFRPVPTITLSAKEMENKLILVKS